MKPRSNRERRRDYGPRWIGPWRFPRRALRYWLFSRCLDCGKPDRVLGFYVGRHHVPLPGEGFPRCLPF